MNSCNYKLCLWAGFVGGPGGPNLAARVSKTNSLFHAGDVVWGAVAAASRTGPFLESSVDLVWRAFFQPLIPGST